MKMFIVYVVVKLGVKVIIKGYVCDIINIGNHLLKVELEEIAARSNLAKI